MAFRAAAGYAELGMKRESIAELNAIENRPRIVPEVLQLRLHHLMREKKWAHALSVSRKLCRVAPDAPPDFSTPDSVCTSSAKRLQAKKASPERPGRAC